SHIRDACFSADGRTLAIASGGAILFLDVETGKPVAENLRLDEKPERIAYSPDGRWVAAAFDAWKKKPLVRTWAAGTGQPLASMRLANECRLLRFARDSRFLLTATERNSRGAVQLWDVATGEALSVPISFSADWDDQLPPLSADGRTLFTHTDW